MYQSNAMTMVSNPNVDLNLNENKNYFCFKFQVSDFKNIEKHERNEYEDYTGIA